MSACVSESTSLLGLAILQMFWYELQDAQVWLGKALTSAEGAGSDATDKQVAQTKFHLGCVCWALVPDSQVVNGTLLLFTPKVAIWQPQACFA